MNVKKSPPKVGLIGIGLLGAAIAERLIQCGFSVIGFDVEPERRKALTSMGGFTVESARNVAKLCPRIVLSLPDSKAVVAIVDEIQDQLRAETMLVDTTTGDPQVTVELAGRLARAQVFLLDATVAGSSEQARRGEVIVLAGGDAAAFAASLDILKSFSARQFHLGPAGSGARMKLVVNLAIGLNRLALAEALAFGEACGFESKSVLSVLMASPSHSRVMDIKGEKMVQRDFSVQARLRQHLKDVRLILASGAEHDAKLPLSKLHAELLENLVSNGFGDEDNSAVFRAFGRGEC